MDQSGCSHVNMDLYRFCYKIAPWSESELLADAFELARFAREIDIRASPYKLVEIGFDPIRVETADGRAEDVRRQLKIAASVGPIRLRDLMAYWRVNDVSDHIDLYRHRLSRKVKRYRYGHTRASTGLQSH